MDPVLFAIMFSVLDYNEVTHLGAHSDEAAWHGVHEVVLLGEEADDPGVDGAAGQLPLAVLAHQPGPDLDLLAHLQHAAQNRAASHAPAQVLHLAAGQNS